MATKIIALTGPKGSGKDTVASYLITRKHALRLAFADRIRQALSIIYDIPVDVLADPVAKEKGHPNLPEGMVLRDAQKFMGEEVKAFDPNLWINPVIREINALRQQDRPQQDPKHESLIVITDVRFPAEVAALKAVGAEFHYIYRPAAEEKLKKSVLLGACHVSEKWCLEYRKNFPVFDNTADCCSPWWEQNVLSTFCKG